MAARAKEFGSNQVEPSTGLLARRWDTAHFGLIRSILICARSLTRRPRYPKKATIWVCGRRLQYEDAVSLVGRLRGEGSDDRYSAAAMIELGLERRIAAVPLSPAEETVVVPSLVALRGATDE
jgi:hypothetical protein